MGTIDEDLWKILAYRLQGRLLQSEIYSNIVVETTDCRGSPQVISLTDWRCDRGVWCAVGNEESVSGMVDEPLLRSRHARHPWRSDARLPS